MTLGRARRECIRAYHITCVVWLLRQIVSFVARLGISWLSLTCSSLWEVQDSDVARMVIFGEFSRSHPLRRAFSNRYYLRQCEVYFRNFLSRSGFLYSDPYRCANCGFGDVLDSSMTQLDYVKCVETVRSLFIRKQMSSVTRLTLHHSLISSVED